MDWVEGRSWNEFEESATPEERSRYTAQAAKAIRGALKAGIAPYDLHGANYLISREAERLTFVDFGAYGLFDPPAPPSWLSPITPLFSCFTTTCHPESNLLPAKAIWSEMGRCLTDISDKPEVIRSVDQTRSKLDEGGMTYENYQTLLKGLKEVKKICTCK